ncbi:transient receptor potential cation channel subfamily M member 1-like isoform X2 [Stegodyphus dumicola]|uniref:transient receptor potential cation channel subfamily M member 1-like isoform X2 n=1 Tax=Stegodyphus dumicola TaxID=202533 RepID=UPI0015B305A3|nr:transient receptor potential cation channel subfamily M member 1-like isoform X2 [Stegodyphus dumicola]
MCDCLCLDNGKDSDIEDGDIIKKNSENLWKLGRYSSMTEIHPHLFQFLAENFTRKECTNFEPGPQQPNCVCGGTFKEHKSRAVFESVLPGTVDRRKVLPANEGPRIKSYPTNAYGNIEFQMDGFGLLKPAKYIRLADDNCLDSLVNLMQNYWKMNEPRPPQFIISVIGNTSSFVDNHEWKQSFGDNLVKALLTANAWLFTGGLNFGLVKVVGDAVRKRQYLVSMKERMIHGINCIGVAKWGCVENNDLLINTDPKEMHYSRYKVKPHHKLESGRAYLNPGHTHFLFVDDGTKRICKGTEVFRVELMHKISSSKEEEGLAIPSILLVLGGDIDSIDEILLCLQKDIPVLLCCGSGDIADIIAVAISCCSASGSKCERMAMEEDKDLIRNMLNAYFKKHTKNGAAVIETRIKDIYKCCKKKHLISIFEIHGNESLDLHILSTVIKHKRGASLRDQLLLAVSWNRPDVAKKLFPDCGSWPLDIIEEAMTSALITNKPAFVKLLLKRGIVMRDYLTVGLLRTLYNECLCENEAALAVLKDLTHKDRHFNLRDISNFLGFLMRKHRHDIYQQDITCKRGIESTGISGEHFEQPFRELFIWAIIVLRTEMALFFWSETQKPLQMSIVATALYWRLNMSYENEEKSIYVDKKQEFEKIAIGVLEECDKMDWKKTSEILNFRDPYWGNMTLLDIAILAYDRALMSTETCIKLTEQLWFGKLESSTVLKLSLTIFNPLLIGIGYLRYRNDPDAEREPNIFKKIYYFYSCPAIKMMVLFIIQQPSDPKDNKLMEWLHGYFWNKLDVVWVLFFFLGVSIRLTSQFVFIGNWIKLDDIHLIYTFSCILSYIRLYEFYMTMSHIGPKLIVLKRMIGDLIVFFLIVAVCILCYGIGRVALLHRERQPFWNVFTEIFSLPYWHLFGELDLDEDSAGRFPRCETDPSYCHQSPHAWIVPILLGIYMLIGNILLVNMLIAVFTHVFDEVNTNSREIYLFEIYVSGLQFSRRSILPPPFLIVEDLLYGTYYLCLKLYKKMYSKCCCCYEGVSEKWKMQKRLHRVYVGNLRLFEKEARAKYLKKASSPDEQSLEAAKIDQRISYLRDLVKKVHLLQYEQNAKYNTKSMKRSKSKEFSLRAKSQSTPIHDDRPTEDEDDVQSHLDLDDFILQWSTIKKCATQQQLARSWVETDNRLMQIENYLNYIITKLENIDQAVMKINEGVIPI